MGFAVEGIERDLARVVSRLGGGILAIELRCPARAA